MKQILLTNDDGIHAPGLECLARAAKHFGRVWIVAPDGERSAGSHCITIQKPVDVIPVDYPVPGVKAFACSGMPADCVRVGVHHVLPGKPDVVLSGVNKGYNVASDLQYSGTAGAAFEAVFQGCRAIALSEGFGDCHEVRDTWLEKILESLMEEPYEAGVIWNVNFPDCPLSECKGLANDRSVSRGMFFRDTYDVRETLPNGGVRLSIHGHHREDAEEGSDYRAVLSNYISVGRVSNVGYSVS